MTPECINIFWYCPGPGDTDLNTTSSAPTSIPEESKLSIKWLSYILSFIPKEVDFCNWLLQVIISTKWKYNYCMYSNNIFYLSYLITQSQYRILIGKFRAILAYYFPCLVLAYWLETLKIVCIFFFDDFNKANIVNNRKSQ